MSPELLSPAEAILLLVVLTGAVFLVFSVTMALWTFEFRRRKRAAEATTRDRRGHWQHDLQNVLSGDADAHEFGSSVSSAERIDFLNFLLLYTHRVEGEERARLAELASPHLPAILASLRHPMEGRRMRAVRTLGELGLPEYAKEVVAALDDPSPDVAMVAATALARAENSVLAHEVLARLDRFAHWRRDFLAAMLASMGPEAAPAFRLTLGDSTASVEVRSVVADALALLGDPDAAPVALDVLGSSDSVELRAATLRVLAAVGSADHLEAIRDALASPELPVRLAAVRALGPSGVSEDLAPLERLAREDPSPWVAIAAARALKEAGGARSLELLAGSDHPRAGLGLQVMSETRSW